VTVLVVGAGPAGVATALLLARHGIDVTLVDREPSFERVFRGEGLMPLGLDALREIGLDVVHDDAVPGRPVRSWDIWIDGEESFVVPEPLEELGDRAPRVVSQPALLARLVELAQGHPGFTFRPGVRCAALLRDDGQRVVGARLSGPDGVEDLATELVVGADGRGSSVRTHAGLRLERSSESYEVLWFKVSAPPRLRDRCSFMICVRPGGHPAVCYVSWDGRLQYGLVMPSGGLRELDDRDWLTEAVRSAPRWLAEHVVAHRAEIGRPTRLVVLVGRCPSWTDPGVLLLGDAAHPMSPVRAQGINLALRDAVVAANHLRPVLAARSGPAALDGACRAVQAEREPEIVRAQAQQRREASGQPDARAGGWRFRLARRGARLLGRRRWAQRAWLRRQHALRFGSAVVRLDP
jgi:2-polyprenyl-6-methoxyphenol hydroxylase-like FAD-dependent oxidoreductase